MLYNFKRNTNIYVVYAGNRYLLSVYPDVTFSQTFKEESYSVKTLHAPTDNFDGAVITSANPANFNFTIPLIEEEDFQIIFDLLVNYSGNSINSFDLYAEADHGVYKIATCVFEAGTFRLAKGSIMLLELSGSGSQLSRIGTKGVYTVPGTPIARSSTMTYIVPRISKTTIGGSTLDYVASVSLELQNKISWTPADTLQASLAVTNASNTIYPTEFTLEGRILSGSVTQYVTSDDFDDQQTWSTGSPITIQVGYRIPYTLDVSIPSAVYTNRTAPGDLYTQTWDFRMLTNPTALSSVITYN
jgi:hypothetical protein